MPDQYKARGRNDNPGFGNRSIEDDPYLRDRVIDVVLRDQSAMVQIPRRAIRAESIRGVETVSQLPADAVAGDQVLFAAALAGGVVWHLVYRPDGSATYPWVKVGGAPLYAAVDAAEGSASGSYVDLATVGPSITVPLAGDYRVLFDAEAAGTVATGLYYTSPKFGAAATLDADSVRRQPAGVNFLGAGAPRLLARTVTAAGTVVKLQHRVNAGTGTWQARWLEVDPVRVV